MIETLRAARAFAHCTAAEIEKIAAICERMTVKPGEQFIEPESPADTVYVVADGAIELRFYATYYNEPQAIPVDRLFKGDLLGWSAIIERGSFTLAAVALEESHLLRIPGEKLRTLCAADDHLAYVVLKDVSSIIARRFTLVLKMLMGFVQDSFKRREPGA